MAKLIATYTAGMFAVFTEDRSGMRQRALIDIGDKVPTPKEMADLAGVLSDQWHWQEPAIHTPKEKVLSELARSTKAVKRTREKEIPYAERERLTVEFLANHPKSTAREIISGSGFEPDDKRIGRWHHSFIAMMKANIIVAELVINKRQGGIVRQYVYSLPKGNA